jgi:hypothetical protein
VAFSVFALVINMEASTNNGIVNTIAAPPSMKDDKPPKPGTLVRARTNSFCGDLFDLSDSDKQLISELCVPVPINEEERIRVLRQTRLLDSNTSDPTFDRFTSLCQRLFAAPVALLSLIDVNRQWFKSKIGEYVVP